MRWINGFLCVLMALFALVQYNDPDGVMWFAIYAVPAVWAGVAAVRPNALLERRLVPAAYGLCLAAAIAGSIWLWPAEVGGWWDNEEVREGLGLIIATMALLFVGLGMLRRDRVAIAR